MSLHATIPQTCPACGARRILRGANSVILDHPAWQDWPRLLGLWERRWECGATICFDINDCGSPIYPVAVGKRCGRMKVGVEPRLDKNDEGGGR